MRVSLGAGNQGTSVLPSLPLGWPEPLPQTKALQHLGVAGDNGACCQEITALLLLLLFCSAGAEGVKLSSEARCERGWTVVFRPLQPTASNF